MTLSASPRRPVLRGATDSPHDAVRSALALLDGDGAALRAVAAELAGGLSGGADDVRAERPDRLLYATDASIYEMEPVAVVFPRSAADVQHVAARRRAARGRGAAARRRHQPGGAGRQSRHRARLHPAHGPCPLHRRRGAHGPRAARRRADAAGRRRPRARPALPRRPLDREPRDDRRRHRQQLLRGALGPLRQDGRQRRRDRGRAGRRIARDVRAARRRRTRREARAVRPRRRDLPRRRIADGGSRRGDRAALPRHPAPGVGLQPRRRAAGSRQPRTPDRGLRGHARRRHGGDRAPRAEPGVHRPGRPPLRLRGRRRAGGDAGAGASPVGGGADRLDDHRALPRASRPRAAGGVRPRRPGRAAGRGVLRRRRRRGAGAARRADGRPRRAGPLRHGRHHHRRRRAGRHVAAAHRRAGPADERQGRRQAGRLRRGHGRRAGEAGRLRRPLRRHRGGARRPRRLLRPRRRGLPAHPPGGQPQATRRPGHDGRDRIADRRPRRRVRRQPQRRARRRHRARRVHGAAVRPGADRRLPRPQARLRPPGPAQPRQDHRHAALRGQPAPGAGDGQRDAGHRARLPRRRRPRRGAGAVQRAGRLPQVRRRHVPLLHGHPRRGALDARPGQPAAPGAQRRPARRRHDRRPHRRGARPLRRVQGLQGRVPLGRRHGEDQVRGAQSALRRARRPAARPRLRPRQHAGPLGQPRRPAGQPPRDAAAGAGVAASLGRRASRPPTAALRPSDLPALVRRGWPHRARRPRPPRRGGPLPRHLHRLLPPRGRRRRDGRAGGPGLSRASGRGPGLLRAAPPSHAASCPWRATGRAATSRRCDRWRPAACRSSARSRRAC